MAQVQAAKDTLALAVASYDPTAFDTIAWDDSGAAVERGATVYRFSCQKCHGPNGDGEGDFVQAGDTIRPPSFQGEGWAFAEE